MALTPEQIDAINTRTLGHQHFARAIEAEARRDALEEAARVCDQLTNKTMDEQQGPPGTLSNVMLRQVALLGHGECAAAIRKLKEDIQ